MKVLITGAATITAVVWATLLPHIRHRHRHRYNQLHPGTVRDGITGGLSRITCRCGKEEPSGAAFRAAFEARRRGV